MVEFEIDVFLNPKKYARRLPLEKIVADTKVYRQGVERYKQKIMDHEDVGPIIVIKHPHKELYAVLDGHHRYYAYLELNINEIDCAIAGDYSSTIFHMTKLGLFQPNEKITEYLRIPTLKFQKDLEQFLTEFLIKPEKIKQLMKEYIKRIKDL